jgi:hypothetical protein
MSQAELIEAVQFYLNEKVLKRPVKVTSVKEDGGSRSTVNHVLHVVVEDDQEHLPTQIKDADRDMRAA